MSIKCEKNQIRLAYAYEISFTTVLCKPLHIKCGAVQSLSPTLRIKTMSKVQDPTIRINDDSADCWGLKVSNKHAACASGQIVIVDDANRTLTKECSQTFELRDRNASTDRDNILQLQKLADQIMSEFAN
jgi:hypothetical protein